ncbi:unnamed protein product [Ilex paraguariensis]|uniref:Uncharacterized protein n=1 Tax=Ilex paraguariensis TaxID=185542 RepID=A0ABC8UXP4_9AQUA
MASTPEHVLPTLAAKDMASVHCLGCSPYYYRYLRKNDSTLYYQSNITPKLPLLFSPVLNRWKGYSVCSPPPESHCAITDVISHSRFIGARFLALKMVKQGFCDGEFIGRARVPMEVMGLMLEEFVDEYATPKLPLLFSPVLNRWKGYSVCSPPPESHCAITDVISHSRFIGARFLALKMALVPGLKRHYYSIAINYRKYELEERILLNLHKNKQTDGLTLR